MSQVDRVCDQWWQLLRERIVRGEKDIIDRLDAVVKDMAAFRVVIPSHSVTLHRISGYKDALMTTAKIVHLIEPCGGDHICCRPRYSDFTMTFLA